MEDRKPQLGLNAAGLGLTVGDWQIGGIPVTGTDNRHDSPQALEAALRAECDAEEARRHGETLPNPLLDLLRPPPRADLRQDPLMRILREAPRT